MSGSDDFKCICRIAAMLLHRSDRFQGLADGPREPYGQALSYKAKKASSEAPEKANN